MPGTLRRAVCLATCLATARVHRRRLGFEPEPGHEVGPKGGNVTDELCWPWAISLASRRSWFRCIGLVPRVRAWPGVGEERFRALVHRNVS